MSIDDPTPPPKKGFVALASVRSPPLSPQARRDVGYYLNLVQEGESLVMPISRPMPIIGPGVHELRLSDRSGDWRFIYRVTADEVVLVDIFKKTTRKTRLADIARSMRRLNDFDGLPRS